MTARIYRQKPSAMQSGRGQSGLWVVDLGSDARRSVDPLMGWTSIDDTQSQVRLTFASREDAIAYARRGGLAFVVEESRDAARLVKSYSENFSARRKQPWTH